MGGSLVQVEGQAQLQGNFQLYTYLRQVQVRVRLYTISKPVKYKLLNKQLEIGILGFSGTSNYKQGYIAISFNKLFIGLDYSKVYTIYKTLSYQLGVPRR